MGAALALASCGGDDAASDAVPAPDTTQPENTGPDEQSSVVVTAIADLVQRIGASESAIAIARHESVTWSDGSIGCPDPAMSYTRSLVPQTTAERHYTDVISLV